MNLNKNQRIVLTIGALVVLFLCICTPRVWIYRAKSRWGPAVGTVEDVGHHFLWESDWAEYDVDYQRVLMEISGVVVGVGMLVAGMGTRGGEGKGS